MAVFTNTGPITLFAVPAYAVTHGYDGWRIAAMVIGVVFCELSIIAGYHRLCSHSSSEAHWLVKVIFAIGGTFIVLRQRRIAASRAQKLLSTTFRKLAQATRADTLMLRLQKEYESLLAKTNDFSQA